MDTVAAGGIALWGTFEALPGRDPEAESFFAQTARTVAGEPGTTICYAVRIGSGRYGMFQVYTDQAALDAHQAGAAGKDAVESAVGEIFASAPQMTRSTVIHAKAPTDPVPSDDLQ